LNALGNRQAEKIGADRMLARIVAMVSRPNEAGLPFSAGRQVAGYFVPAVLLVAAIAFGVWAVWGPQPLLAYALIAAVSVVIIACPCALGLAMPMSIGRLQLCRDPDRGGRALSGVGTAAQPDDRCTPRCRSARYR
jgi:hypothetical protein